MPQKPLETLLINRVPKPPRDPVKWGGGTLGNSDAALDLDNLSRALLEQAKDATPQDPIQLDDFPPSPENITLVNKLDSVGKTGITQDLFDALRGNKSFSEANWRNWSKNPKPYFDTVKDK